MIDCVYILKKDETKKTKYDVVSSTQNYPVFEMIKKELIFYRTDGFYIKGRDERKTKFTLSEKSLGHLTKIKQINSEFAIGDVKGTNDLILFRILNNWDEMQLFILKGKKHDEDVLKCQLIDNDYELINSLNNMVETSKRAGE